MFFYVDPLGMYSVFSLLRVNLLACTHDERFVKLIYIYYIFKLMGNTHHFKLTDKFSLIYMTIDLNILHAVQWSQTTYSYHLYQNIYFSS